MYSSEGLSERYVHLNNCGRQILSVDDTVTIRPNGRIDYHILYVISGVCHAVVNGTEYKAGEGSFILYRPRERQEYRFYKSDKSEMLWIHFTGVGCEAYLRELGIYDTEACEIGMNSELSSALENMIRAKRVGGEGSEEICDGYLFLVLALMARGAKCGRERLKRFSEVSLVIDYMNSNYKAVLPVAEYARMCHLSKSRFEHVFKENTGVTPIGYLFKIRIDTAMQLLENTDLRISRIAEETGFSDANYFSRIFKKHLGVTPVKYREKFSGR